jgi:hypothetical protein
MTKILRTLFLFRDNVHTEYMLLVDTIPRIMSSAMSGCVLWI